MTHHSLWADWSVLVECVALLRHFTVLLDSVDIFRCLFTRQVERCVAFTRVRLGVNSLGDIPEEFVVPSWYVLVCGVDNPLPTSHLQVFSLACTKLSCGYGMVQAVKIDGTRTISRIQPSNLFTMLVAPRARIPEAIARINE